MGVSGLYPLFGTIHLSLFTCTIPIPISPAYFFRILKSKDTPHKAMTIARIVPLIQTCQCSPPKIIGLLIIIMSILIPHYGMGTVADCPFGPEPNIRFTPINNTSLRYGRLSSPKHLHFAQSPSLFPPPKTVYLLRFPQSLPSQLCL